MFETSFICSDLHFFMEFLPKGPELKINYLLKMEK